jgi:flavin reductase (DIM6/NTAB) family NADH-FMN oxidoreductase RutF
VTDVAALFNRLTLGVYVVGVAHGERRDAFTAAWVMQASYDPPLLVVSVSPSNASFPLFHDGGAFTVNVLKRGQLVHARHFGTLSGRDRDKLEGFAWHAGRGGAPVLDDALAYFECEVTESRPAGDHVLVTGRVVGGRVLVADGKPMLYAETGDMDGSRALYPARL